MTYSVWDHPSRSYHYYEAPGKDHEVNSPKPKHLGSSALGTSPDRAAWPLPSGARLVGKGRYPKGHIASRKSGMALGLIPDITPTNLLLWGALGYMVYTYIWKPAQR